MSYFSRAAPVVVLLIQSSLVKAFDLTLPWVNREASVEITETLVLDYHDSNFDPAFDPTDDNYGDVHNRLNLKLALDEFTFSARIDTATFILAESSGAYRAKPPFLDRYGLEKLSATYQGGNWQLELGDFYASFGRGIALRIRKIDELSEDTTLLGAKGGVQVGLVEITGLAGLSNPTNIDGVTEKTLEDPYDLISGLRAAFYPSEVIVTDVHVVWVWYDALHRNDWARDQIEMSNLPRQALVVGTSLELLDLSDLADVYGEFNWMQRELKLPDLPGNDGWALYLSGSLYLGNWTVTAEIKSYRDYELFTETDGGKYRSERLDYVRPPTLEPEDMEVDNNFDVTGARLRVDWRPGGSDTLLFASYAGFVAQDLGKLGDRWIYNAQLGVERNLMKPGRVKLNGGLREEVPDYSGGEHRQLIYLNADLKLPLTARHSLELHGTNWWVHSFRGPAVVSNTLKGEWILAYSFSPLLSVGCILGYDTERSHKRDLEVFFINEDGRAVRQGFLAGSLTINLSSRVVFNLLAGQLRGGPKCVNGACRHFPPFAGVRLETVIRL